MTQRDNMRAATIMMIARWTTRRGEREGEGDGHAQRERERERSSLH